MKALETLEAMERKTPMVSRSSWLPLSWHVAEKQVMVIGGGEVATRKVGQFLGRGAHLTVVAPEVTGELRSWSDQFGLKLIERPAVPGDLNDADLVILATDQPALQEQFEQYCSANGIYCNRCDTGTGDFRTLSVIEQGDIQISISTNGKSPVMAAQLKATIESWLGEDLAEKVDLLGVLRNRIKEEVADPLERKALLRQASAYTVEALKRILDDEDNYSRFKGQQTGIGSDPLGNRIP